MSATPLIKNPTRVSRVYKQSLIGCAAEVFPLLCPVREAEWLSGWAPTEVRSQTGVAEVDCVFMTPAHQGEVATWMITQHDPERHVLQMIKLTPGVTACRIDIAVRDTGDNRSEAVVRYTHTSLGSAGDAFVAAFTEAYYDVFMREWQDQMNSFLKVTSKAAQ